MAGTWGAEDECHRCGGRYEREHHARKRHGTVIWTCEICKEYQSERRWDVERHKVGCRRRSRTVATKTVGQWDASPQGQNREDKPKGVKNLQGARGSREKEKVEHTKGKDEGERKAPVANGEKKEKEKAGEKRKVQEVQESGKRRTLKGEVESLDPPPVQRLPTLEYLKDLGSPIQELKTPKQDTQWVKGKQGEKVTKEEESEVAARAGRKGRKDLMSYEVDVGPGTVWRKVVRKTYHPDGRVTIEEEEEILRACDCKTVVMDSK